MCNVNTPTSIYLTIWTSQGVLKSPSQEVGEGIDITHTPHQTNVLKSPNQEVGGYWHYTYPPPNQCAQVSKSRGGGYWHYTYLPNWCAQVSKSRGGGGVLTLHIPPKLMCSSLQVKRWGGIDITHTPPHQTDVLKSPSQKVGGVLTLHIPLPHQTDVLKSPSQEVGGIIDITHTPLPTRCGKVSEPRTKCVGGRRG